MCDYFLFMLYMCVQLIFRKNINKWNDSVSCIKLNSVRSGESRTYACLVHIISTEVNNIALESILTKVVSSSRKDWVDILVEATWAYNTTWKTTTGFTPYDLIYGKKALLAVEFESKP